MELVNWKKCMAWSNVTVLPGVTIGEGSVIAAGVPAKVMREVKRTKEAGHNIN